MKKALLVERIVFIFLLLMSGGIAYILLIKKNAFSSDNALLLILSVIWFILEYKTIKKTFKKVRLFSKKLFHLPPKKKLRRV